MHAYLISLLVQLQCIQIFSHFQHEHNDFLLWKNVHCKKCYKEKRGLKCLLYRNAHVEFVFDTFWASCRSKYQSSSLTAHHALKHKWTTANLSLYLCFKGPFKSKAEVVHPVGSNPDGILIFKTFRQKYIVSTTTHF